MRDARRNAANLAIGEPIVLDAGQVHGSHFLQRGARARPLDSDLGVPFGSEFHPRIEMVAGADMLVVLLLVGGVDAQEKVVAGHLVDQNIVHEAAVGVEQPGVMRLADFELAGMVGGDEIGQLRGFRPANLDFAHMADIENAHRVADGVVLVDDPGVLHGHVPAAEVDHPGSERAMEGMKRGGAERRSGRHENSG